MKMHFFESRIDKSKKIGYNKGYMQNVERGGAVRYKKSVFRSLAMVTQLGLSVLAPILLCIFIGYQVDSRYGMKTLVPLLILGVLAGGKSAWHLAMKTVEQEDREDKALLLEQQGQTERTGSSRPKQPSRIRKNGSEDAGTGMQKRQEKVSAGISGGQDARSSKQQGRQGAEAGKE